MRALRHRMTEEQSFCRPHRIVLVRHGESEGNVDSSKYCHIADPKIRLTDAGMMQAQHCGQIIRRIIDKGGEDWRIFFYVSPYIRTLSTLKEIGKAFDKQHIEGVREEPRIREQDFGNFQEHNRMQAVKDTRDRFGRFFYRFPEGESVADVFDRVTIIWTTEQFEKLRNPLECEVRVMQLGDGGEYSLLVHHTREELQQWRLSVDMIVDQEFQKTARRGEYSEDWPWSGTQFFDHFNETEAGGGNDAADGDDEEAKRRKTANDARTPLDMLDLEETAEGEREPTFRRPASSP